MRALNASTDECVALQFSDDALTWARNDAKLLFPLLTSYIEPNNTLT